MQTTIALSQIHYQNTSFKNKQLEDPPTHLRSGLSSFFLGDVIYSDYFFVAMRNVMISLAVEIIRYFVFFCQLLYCLKNLTIVPCSFCIHKMMFKFDCI